MICYIAQNMLSMFGFIRVSVTKKEKRAFWQTSINISSSFALEKKAFHLYLLAISKEIKEFICSQESREQVFSFFFPGLVYKSLSLNFVHKN